MRSNFRQGVLEGEAIISNEAGNYAKAEPLFRRVLAIREKALGPEHRDVAQSLNNLAVLLQGKGDLAGAEPLHHRALAIREKVLGLGHQDFAQSLYNLANLLHDKGELAETEPLHRRALAIREKALGLEHPLVAASLNRLAYLLTDRGDLAEAEPLHRRALTIFEKARGPVHQDVAASLGNLALLLYDRGDLAEAERLNRRALTIFEKTLGPEHRDFAQMLNNLANLLKDKGDTAGAESLYRRALVIWEKVLGPEHSDIAQSLINIAALLEVKGDLIEAESLNRRALAIREKALGLEHRDVAQSLNSLAALLQGKGDLAGAEPLHRRALTIREKVAGPEHPSVAESLNNLAILTQDKGDLARAEPLHRRALAIREKALGTKHRNVAQSLNNLAILLNDRGEFTDSLGFARRAAKSGYPIRSPYLSALQAYGKEHPGMKAESFEAIQQTLTSEAGTALRSLALRASTGSGDLAKLVRNEQDLASELARLESAILVEVSKEPAQRRETREEAIRSRNNTVTGGLAEIREKLARAFPGYAELSRPSALSLPDAQQLLSSDEALIVIDIAGKGEEVDYVWAVTRGAVEWQEINARQGEVAESIARLRGGLDLSEFDRAPIDPALAHELYAKLLGPVESVIAGKTHLIFVLNGAVSSLPPQVLVTKPPAGTDLRDAAWLVRDHAITVLPTVSSLKLLRDQASLGKAPKPFRGYGDPVFDSEKEGSVRMATRNYGAYFRGGLADIAALRANAPRLPGTARELRAVAASLGAPESEIILREAASEAAVKQAPLADYNIVYFATHGLVAGEVEQFNKEAAEPALLLTIPEKASEVDDGLLTASEIAQLKLNADWVVMSACNTAAEGKPGAGALSGLARAFFYAGARSLLVSHWVVDDEATAELMSRTFANAAANPSRRQAEALREAQLSVMNDPDHPEWADPGYWAPFVLVGEAR